MSITVLGIMVALLLLLGGRTTTYTTNVIRMMGLAAIFRIMPSLRAPL